MAAQQIFIISGRVIEQKTRKGVPGLRVEAWDKDEKYDDLVASAVTDAQGAFAMTFDAARFREYYPEAQPDLFFKVFRGDELVESTEDSVLWNVQAGETQIVIKVDLPVESQPFVVRGQLRQPDGSPLAGVVVRAFDQDLRRAALLGESFTGKQGEYTIGYAAAQFTRPEKERADLIVRVFTPKGSPVGESDVVYQAARVETLDLTVSLPEEKPPSEHEQLLADLTPALQDAPLAELSDKEIAFLAGQTSIAQQRIALLRDAARLARQTGLTAEVLYGLARQELPLDLKELLRRDDATLLAALEGASKANIIPAQPRESLERATHRLETLRFDHDLLARRRVTGRLLDAETGAPLAGLAVRAFDLGAGSEPKYLGHSVANRQGLFTLAYTAPARSEADETERKLGLRVLDRQSQQIYQTDIHIGAEQTEVTIQVPAQTLPKPPTHPLGELAASLKLALPADLLPFLAGRDIQTLEDVRRAAGIGHLDNLPVAADDPAVLKLEAHANLSVLSDDARLNEALIERGFNNVATVAATPQARFARAVREQLSEEDAVRLHTGAQAQTRLLNNALTQMRAERANGYPAPSETDSLPLPDGSDQVCACRDCEAAVSPLAYLTDLLDYTVRHVERAEDSTLTLPDLSDTFHQPFGDLPASCEAVEAQVRQVRLCVEVLRRHLAPATLTEREEKRYGLAAYTTLLTRLGASYAEIRLARTADDATRQQLADRLGIGVEHLDSLFLDSAADLDEPLAVTEEAMERLFGLAATRRADGALPDPLREVGDALLQTWRLEHLRTLWQQQDWPADPYVEEPTGSYTEDDLLPIVDPDLIGPDDFRSPSPGGPFDLWIKRREWVDSQLAELCSLDKLTVMLEQMYKEIQYNGRRYDPPWADTTPVGDLTTLAENLAQGQDVEATVQRLRADLKLTVESFTRLMAIQAQDDAGQEIKEDEWREVYSILAQAQKVSLFPVWREEEQASHVRLGPGQFWLSLHEPNEGEWPPALAAGRPLIDPDVVGLQDLPEPTAGERALALWRARQAVLDGFCAELEAARESRGLNGLMVAALGAPPTGDEWESYLNKLLSRLNSEGPEAIGTELDDCLYMTAARFTRLMEIKSKENPSAEEWAEGYAILASARKEREALPSAWCDEERAALDGKYWRALKARLPRWRATVEARQTWQQALRQRSRTPLVDPDLLNPGDLKNKTHSDPAFSLLASRRVWVDRRLHALKTQCGRHASGLDAILEGVLGVPPTELEALADEREQGYDVAPRLEQLSLAPDAFSHLIRLRRLVGSGATLLDSEWEDVYAILAQVEKRRRFADWQDEERTAGIVLSPDYFQIPAPPPLEFPPPEPLPLPAWRAAWRDRREWQDRLVSRIEQEMVVIQALQEVVSAAEEETLPLLRDALIMASDFEGTSLAAKAKRATDALLIDAQAGGCQKTTRIAQAIETIQGLLWSLRTGQLKDTYPDLTLDAERFDEEWQWIGSYATWRAAMFVFLYPENILLPSLRKRQTPAFEELIRKLRLYGSRLDPQSAQDLAREYESYFKDVCSLKLEAAAQTNRRVYVVARAEFTESLYVTDYTSSYFSEFTLPHAQSFWRRIKELDGLQIGDVVGVAPYQQDYNTQEYIYLFVKLIKDGQEKLAFLTCDVAQDFWQPEPTELELPEETRTFSAVVQQNFGSRRLPCLGILTAGKLYVRRVAGNGWEEGEWGDFKIADEASHRLPTPHGVQTHLAAMLQWGLNDLLVVLQKDEGWHFHRFGLDAVWAGPFDGQWIGAIAWERRNVYLLGNHNDTTYCKKLMETADEYGAFDFAVSQVIGLPSAAGLLTEDVTEEGSEVHTVTFSHAIYAPREPDHTLHRAVFKLKDDVFSPPNELESAPLIAPLECETEVALEPDVIKFAEQNEKLFASHLDLAPPAAIMTYLEESLYFVPLAIALQLQRAGQYTAALDWFRTVYDYSAPSGRRKIYYRLIEEESLSAVYERAQEWLLDPLNPHQIAAQRANTYTRFTILALVRCLLDYADAEFAHDTAESVPRARILYTTALELLDAAALRQRVGDCEDLIGALEIEVGAEIEDEAPYYLPLWLAILQTLNGTDDFPTRTEAVDAVMEAIAAGEPWEMRLIRAMDAIGGINPPPPRTLGMVVAAQPEMMNRAYTVLLSQPAICEAVVRAGNGAGNHFQQVIPKSLGSGPETITYALKRETGTHESLLFPTEYTETYPYQTPSPQEEHAESRPYQPVPAYYFCIPPNPVLQALRLHAELNLYKLRTCRNIAGVERQIEPYTAPTDTVSGLPQIGAGGQLALPGAVTLQPTPYRYQVLIERARQLVQLAAQIESAMLYALEKRDAEYYNLLRARQDVALARAGVRLQELRVREAEGGVDLAELQQQRAQIQVETYQEWLDAGLNQYEMAMIEAYHQAETARTLAAFFETGVTMFQASASAGMDPVGAVAAVLVSLMAMGKFVATSLAIQAETTAQVSAVYASYARRAQEWGLQKSVAEQDVSIGAQQVKMAQDRVRLVGQEQKIAEMQTDHAQEILDFLANKFTNVELYDWMSDVLEEVYSFFLQQATAMAQLAANQLAFERQEAPPPFIRADYWQAPTGLESGAGAEDQAPNRRGLTGSTRLLQDIYQLDQYAFETDRRKLQLTKTLSLARMAPVEFQRFRETGVMTFATPLELFDRDFPGHFLRLIKRVRTSIIALIPPTDGIHATLSTIGLSRVVIGSGGFFQEVLVRRPPESVALSSPSNATGLFELTPQPQEMLLPFEGLGVDTHWELRMPQASNLFDYRTIADVLITIEYTALDSYDYRQQVIYRLDTRVSADRPFSFRHQFADQWYDLHNPEQTARPMVVRFETQRADFPPNVQDLRIEQVLLYFARAGGAAFEVSVTHLHFTGQGSAGAVGGGATSIEGVISTLTGSAASWSAMIGQSPIGEWELALLNNLSDGRRPEELFDNEEIEDILFVITYAGHTPAWPAG